MSQDDEVIALLTTHDGDVTKLISSLLSHVRVHRPQIEYLLAEGLTRVLHRNRQKSRAHLKATELSDTVSTPRPMQPLYDTPRARAAIQRRTLTLLATWMIGDIPLGEMNKTGLLRAAAQESAAGRGHYVNAKFYEQLAQPMNNRELVKQHWKDEGVRILHQAVLDEIVSRAAGSSTTSKTEEATASM